MFSGTTPLRTRRLAIGAVVLAAALCVIAWVGYPWTKMQCYEQASNRPAINGVALARHLCAERFGEL